MSFKEGGMAIPDGVLETLAEDEAKFLVELDVKDLPPSVLYTTPHHNTLARDMQPEVHAGVDQYGTIDAQATATDPVELPIEEN